MKYFALILISSVLCVPTYGAPAKADAHTVNTPHSSSGDASASGANAAKASSESGTGGSKAGAGALDSLPHTDGPSMPHPDEVPSVPRPDEIPSGPRPDELPTGPRPDVPRPDEKPYLPSKPPTEPMPSGGLRVDPIPHKGGKKPVTVQKVAASANMETGTAVASATNKRSTDLQNVKASGDKAIADAKIHNSGPGFKSQEVESLGNHLAVAKAEIVKRDTKIQDVKAKGNTAISKATNHQGGDKVVQSVKAEGGNMAIATADNSPSLPPNMSEPAPDVGFLAPASAAPPAPADVLAAPASAAPPAPAPSEGRRRTRREDSTVQNLESSGRVAVSTVSAKTSETVSSVQNVATHGDALSVAHAEKS